MNAMENYLLSHSLMIKLYIYTYVMVCLKAFPFYFMFLSL